MSVISWDNYVDDATITNNSAQESPVNSSESLGTAKLKTRQIGDIFRQIFSSTTSPLDELVLDFDLGSAKATNLLCILNHNFSGNTYIISFGTSAGASDVGQETGTFWSGTSYDATNEMLYFSSAYTAQHVRISVAMAAGNADIGRVWMDNAWATNIRMDFGIGVIDRSTKTKSRAGSTYSDGRQILRKVDVRAFGKSNADFVGTSADFDSFLTMDLAVGESGEVVFLPLTDTQHNRQRMGVYGTISNNSPIRVLDKGPGGYFTEKRFSIEEDRG